MNGLVPKEAPIPTGGCGARLNSLNQAKARLFHPVADDLLVQRIVMYLEENTFSKIIAMLGKFLDQMNRCLTEFVSIDERILSEECLPLRTASSAKNLKRHINRSDDIRTESVQTT